MQFLAANFRARKLINCAYLIHVIYHVIDHVIYDYIIHTY